MRRLLVRCYPARWRARYGDEFAAVLAERPLGPFDVADVLLGALDAHLHLRGPGAASDHRGGFAMSLRLGGSAAIIGGVSWAVALAGAGLTGELTLSPIWPILLVIGTAALIAALVGLSAFQARRFPRLTWAAFILPAVGATASAIGLIAMAVVGDQPFVAGMTPWSIWAIGTLGLMAGSALFALATWRSATFSRGASVLLFIGSLTVVPMLGLTGAGSETLLGQLAAVTFVGLFGAGWVWLGLSALRLDGATFPGAAATAPS
jgi:hypothetical protein